MPMYHIHHSYPLTGPQKEAIAQQITKLHGQAYTTPSMFVNVIFRSDDATAENYYMGGKVKKDTLNCIEAMVRTSEKRTKASFDKLGEDIEHAWLEVLGERCGKDQDEKEFNKQRDKQPNAERAAKQLSYVAFYPILSVREKGFTIPSAGEEGAWVKEHRKAFEERAEQGDENFKDMLQEIEDRDDLKEWRA